MTSLSLFNLGPVPSYFEPSGCPVKKEDFKDGSENKNELIDTLDKNFGTFKGKAGEDRDNAHIIIDRINKYFMVHDNRTNGFPATEWWVNELQILYIYLNELLIVNKDQTCTEKKRKRISKFIKVVKILKNYKQDPEHIKKPPPLTHKAWEMTRKAISGIENGKPDSKSISCYEDCDPI